MSDVILFLIGTCLLSVVCIYNTTMLVCEGSLNGRSALPKIKFRYRGRVQDLGQMQSKVQDKDQPLVQDECLGQD